MTHMECWSIIKCAFVAFGSFTTSIQSLPFLFFGRENENLTQFFFLEVPSQQKEREETEMLTFQHITCLNEIFFIRKELEWTV